MTDRVDSELLDKVIKFHGHLCPGLMTGVRVAEIALREIGPHAVDEEVVAIVETDNCAIDAIQYLTGCTFGKGNLRHLDYGKNVFTFARRSDGKAVRVSRKATAARPADPQEQVLLDRGRSEDATEEERAVAAEIWRRRSLALLEPEAEELFKVDPLLNFRIPERARIHQSIPCDVCGEPTMATRIRSLEERSLCIPCYEAAPSHKG